MNWERVVGWAMTASPIVFVMIAMVIDQGLIVGAMIMTGVVIVVGLVAAGLALVAKGDEKAHGQRTD